MAKYQYFFLQNNKGNTNNVLTNFQVKITKSSEVRPKNVFCPNMTSRRNDVTWGSRGDFLGKIKMSKFSQLKVRKSHKISGPSEVRFPRY